MADFTSATYVALSPVRHNGKLFRTGAPISLGTGDAKRLLAKKCVRVADAPIALAVAPLSASTLAKLTIPELLEQGALLGLTLDPAAGKDAILAAVTAAGAKA